MKVFLIAALVCASVSSLVQASSHAFNTRPCDLHSGCDQNPSNVSQTPVVSLNDVSDRTLSRIIEFMSAGDKKRFNPGTPGRFQEICEKKSGDLALGVPIHLEDLDWLMDDTLASLKGAKAVRIANCKNVTDACLKYFTSVYSLDIEFSNITGEDLSPLMNAHRLALPWGDKITDENLRNLENVRDLRLCRNHELTGSGFQYLTHLRELDIDICTNIQDANLKYVRGIDTLKMSNNDVTDQGLSHLTYVHNLTIERCHNITGESFRDLSFVRDMTIDFCDNVTGASLKYLAHVRRLKIKHCKNITEEDINPLLSGGMVIKGRPETSKVLGASFELVRV